MRGSAAFRAAVAPGGVLAGPWVKNELWRRARAVPSLDLRFAENKSLGDAVTGQSLVTFTRASSGTYVGSDGLIKTATTDEARFDHNPTTGESLGLLVEESRTNLLVQSEDFSTTWAASNLAITTNDITAPNGTLTADKWQNTSTTGVISQLITKAAAATTYTASVWLKSTEAINFSLTVDDGGTTNRARCTFDITTGEILTENDEGDFTNTSATIIAYPDSWHRITVTTTTNTQTTARFRAFFSGTGDSVFIWGAQLEEGSFPTSYIPTTTATVTRNADVASISGNAFSSWYRQDEGTILYDQTVFSYPPATNASFYAFSDGTGDNRISGFVPSGSNHRLRIDESGSNTYIANAVLTADVLSPARVALGFKTNDVNCAYNGTLRSKDESATIPLVNRLNFGEFNAAVDLSTRIKRFIFWPQRLSDSTLANITQ